MKKSVLILLLLLLLPACQKESQPVASVQPPETEQAETETPITHPQTEAPAVTEAVRPVVQADSGVLEISEKMFLTQITDIYLNFDEYRDLTIVVEGMYTLFMNQEGVADTPVVYRRGPGCCGNDGWGGFLLHYDGEYPEDNAWIRVTGTPELVEREYWSDLYLNVTEMEVLETRGEEFVMQ